MTETENMLLAAAEAETNLLGLYADDPRPAGAEYAHEQWRRARTALTAARQVCDLDDADVAEWVYDIEEALGACEHALKLGSAAPVAEVALHGQPHRR